MTPEPEKDDPAFATRSQLPREILFLPQRVPSKLKRLDFKDFPSLTFEAADHKTFRNLALAKEALYRGGNAPETAGHG